MPRWPPLLSLVLCLASCRSSAVTPSTTVTVEGSGAWLPPDPVTGDVVVAIDARVTRPISPLIYGLNFAELNAKATPGLPDGAYLWGEGPLPRFTLNRFGGNRSTAHNWETGFSNCGNDCGPTYQNDGYLLLGTPPGVGAAVRPRIESSFAQGAAVLLTVPILGYVAAEGSGAKNQIPKVPQASHRAEPTPAALCAGPVDEGCLDPKRFLAALPANPKGATATPDTKDAFVYTDDFVKWVDTHYPTGKSDSVKQIQYELDNEVEIWGSTHAELRGTFDGKPGAGSNEVGTGFDELVEKILAHAKAVKSQVPSAVVWAPSFANMDALVELHAGAHPDGPPNPHVYYIDYLLAKLKAAESNPAFGKRLVDVVDMHWYTHDAYSTNDFWAQDATAVNAREQIVRSLWDPDYIEESWVSAHAIPRPDRSRCGGAGCPIRLLPRLQARIDRFYPGTKLAIGEYWYGRGGDISSTIANADALGIFGREGVYAATMWPNGAPFVYQNPSGCKTFACDATVSNKCALLAIDLYRNFDGKGATFGDTYLQTVPKDPAFTEPARQLERVTAYASQDAGNPDRMVVLATNKSLSGSINLAVQVTHTRRFSRAEAWQVTGTNGGAGGCRTNRLGDIPITAVNAFNAPLPAQSVTVLVLRP